MMQDMDTLVRVVESIVTGGLSRALSYVLLAVIAILFVWGIYKYFRWRIRRAFRRKTAAVVQAPGRAIKATARGIASVGGAVTGGVGSAARFVRERVAPAKPEPTLGHRLLALLSFKKQ